MEKAHRFSISLLENDYLWLLNFSFLGNMDVSYFFATHITCSASVRSVCSAHYCSVRYLGRSSHVKVLLCFACPCWTDWYIWLSRILFSFQYNYLLTWLVIISPIEHARRSDALISRHVCPAHQTHFNTSSTYSLRFFPGCIWISKSWSTIIFMQSLPLQVAAIYLLSLPREPKGNPT
jgi:hypothetical protein